MDLNIFRKISYGLYVIGSTKEGKLNGQIANTVFQITSDPAMVVIGLNKNNLTNEFIKHSKTFSVSILPQSVPLDLISHFGFKSGRNINKFASVSFKQGENGAPYLSENSLGYLEAQVINSIEVETHTLFVGKVINSETFSDMAPMTYAYYHQIKSGAGKAPPLSPVEKKPDAKTGNPMQKYSCSVCGYIYDPAEGVPDSGIASGTTFADIPADWVCPVCGVSKDHFEAMFSF